MEYFCKVCKKKYASYKSLWFHNNKYHKETVVQEITTKEIPVVQNVVENVVLKNEEVNDDCKKCKKCGKTFCDRVYRWRHEKKCSINNTINKTDIEIMKKEIEKSKLEIEKTKKETDKILEDNKKEMEKLKAMLQKSLKIHPKTLNKINNQLNNSGTINNITIIQLGNENLSEVLNNKEKKFILDRQAMSINHLVDLIHVSGKYKKFQNVYITNLQSTFAYKFDEKQNKFIAVNKNELITDIVDSRMYDIQKFYDEIYPDLEPKKAEQIKKFIDRMGKEEDELKDVKKEEIKLILYNNREKILQKDENLILVNENDIEV
jgi:hypothetical protein